MKRSALIMLVLSNLVWTFNPLMGKMLLRTYGGLQVAWIRYFGAFVSYLAVVGLILLFDRRKTWRDFFLIPTQFRTALEVSILAIGPFVYAPILQFIGLETAQAMDNSILIATEPLITVLLAWAVLGERMNRAHWLSMGLALIGFFFFSGLVGENGFGLANTAFSIGMLLLVFAQLGEGAYAVFGRKLVQEHPPAAVIGTGLTLGAIVLSGIVFSFDQFPHLGEASPVQLGAIFWLGPIGSTLTYLLWARIARTVTVPSMAITLFIQPLVGAAVGMMFLGESLTPSRFSGALLILAGIAGLLYWEVRQELRRRPAI